MLLRRQAGKNQPVCLMAVLKPTEVVSYLFQLVNISSIEIWFSSLRCGEHFTFFSPRVGASSQACGKGRRGRCWMGAVLSGRADGSGRRA